MQINLFVDRWRGAAVAALHFIAVDLFDGCRRTDHHWLAAPQLYVVRLIPEQLGCAAKVVLATPVRLRNEPCALRQALHIAD